MESPPTLLVAESTGKRDIIGVAAGRTAYPLLRKAADVLPRASWVVVDFSGVDMVSASAARESVLRLCTDLVAAAALPVLVNLNQETQDEVAFAAQACKQPVVVAKTVKAGEPTGLHIYGEMDPKLYETLRFIGRLQEADAKTVRETSGDTSTGVTAWNNRLSALAGLRFLRERKSGKTKYYSLTLKGLVHGQ